MAQINSAQFEALWANAQQQPATTTIAPVPTTADLSLSGVLDKYLALVSKSVASGTVAQADYNDLATAVASVKPVLVRINDSALVTQAMSVKVAVPPPPVKPVTPGTPVTPPETKA